MIDTDLPPPIDHYKLIVTIKGSSKTTIPVNYIYDNLPKQFTKSTKITSVDPISKDITIINIGELNSLNVYSVGFKLVLEGDETLSWTGPNAFCSIQILDSSSAVVVT